MEYILDPVIRASASTYNPSELQRLGLQITLNLNNQKTRYLGEPTNPVYPDIVIWRPDFPNANTGQAIIVEAFENDTLTHSGVEMWRRLSETVGVKVNLIVPFAQLEQTKLILKVQNILNIHLQTWRFDSFTGRYLFN